MMSIEKLLQQIADKVCGLDEASLTQLLPKYKKIMNDFEPTQEWERSVVIFFLINAIRVKNTIFNENVQKMQSETGKPARKSPLKLVKPEEEE